MVQGQQRGMEEHAGTAVAHGLADRFSFFGGIAMDLAGGAEGFCCHAGAVSDALQRIGKKRLTGRAEAIFFRWMMLAMTIYFQHLFQCPAFLLSFSVECIHEGSFRTGDIPVQCQQNNRVRSMQDEFHVRCTGLFPEYTSWPGKKQ